MLGHSLWDDGKSIVFGMAVAYAAVEVTKLALGIRTKTGDYFALPLALGMAVGRWGCFFNGCGGGVKTDLPCPGAARPREESAPRAGTTPEQDTPLELGELLGGHGVAVVGLARCTDESYPPTIEAVKPLPGGMTLAQVKADPRFRNFDLVRISRLAVMPVPENLWDPLQGR